MTELAIKEATIEKGEKREQRNNTKVLVQSLKKASEKVFGPGQWKVKLITFVGAQSTQGRLTKREIGVYWYLFSNHRTRKCIHKRVITNKKLKELKILGHMQNSIRKGLVLNPKP